MGHCASIVLAREDIDLSQGSFFDLNDAASVESFEKEISQGLLLGPEDGLRWRNEYSLHVSESRIGETKVVFVNDTSEDLTLCWIDEEGVLYHFLSLLCPSSVSDGSQSNTVIQYTQPYHCFVIFREHQDYKRSDVKKLEYLHDIPIQSFRCMYRPSVASTIHTVTLGNELGSHSIITNAYVESFSAEKLEVIDLKDREYCEERVFGFSIFYEKECKMKHPILPKMLQEDLAAVCDRLPPEALQRLQKTNIYINSSTSYGAIDNPVEAKYATYHPSGSRQWLNEHGMNEKHEQCIEIFDASQYLEDRFFWGTGGLLCHELSHAYHDKYVSKGYENEEIRLAYYKAMSSNLYDRIQCKSLDPGERYKENLRGYCCTNSMEFFAELSVAFLCPNDEDYNKWYPHNRQQLMKHDPQSYNLLKELWVL